MIHPHRRLGNRSIEWGASIPKQGDTQLAEKQRAGRPWQIHVLGVAGVLGITFWLGGWLLLGYQAWTSSIVYGLAGRVGFMSAAIWIAYPALMPLIRLRSSLGWGMLAAFIVLAAFARTNRLLPLLIGVLMVASTVGWLLKWAGKILGPDED